MKKALFVAVSLLAIQGTACAKTVIVSKADDQKTVVVEEGDILRVALNENPSTGFSWEVSSYDDTMLVMCRKDCRPFDRKHFKKRKPKPYKEGKYGFEREDQSLEEGCGLEKSKSDKKRDCCGAPCRCVFTFHPTATKGTSSLDLVYRRPWETDVTPSETFHITVTVD
jgi:predicted secreted protein